MHRRCYDVCAENYQWYGGEDITICAEWFSFENFYKWSVLNGYSDDLSIDRIDRKKGYEPSNCRWVSMKLQANNRRNNYILEYEGKQYTIAQFSEKIGLQDYTVRNRLKRGWSVEKIANTPERTIHGI